MTTNSLLTETIQQIVNHNSCVSETLKKNKMKKIKNVLIEVMAWVLTFLILVAIIKYIIYG
jgi:hypothetical protein